MKRMLQTSILLAVLMLGSVQVQAQDLKIGYVDPQSILARMPETAAVTQRIQNFFQQKQQELSQKEAAFQQEVANFQQRVNVISEEAKTKEEERLGQLQAELVNFRDEADRAVETRRTELVAPLLQQIQAAIDKVAKDKGLTYVLNTTTTTGDVIVLYVSDEARANADITEDVMRELGILE